MSRMDKWVLAGVIGITLSAFALSYDKLAHAALKAGISSEFFLHLLYPVMVEGFTALASLAVYVTRGTKAQWYPWVVGIMAFGFSLWANSMPEQIPAEVVRGLPSLVIPLSVHMAIIIAKHTKPSQPKPKRSFVESAFRTAAAVKAGMADLKDNVPTAVAALEVAGAQSITAVQATAAPVANGQDKQRTNFLELAEKAPDATAKAFWLARAGAPA